jgi:hypothetical protein
MSEPTNQQLLSLMLQTQDKLGTNEFLKLLSLARQASQPSTP